MKRFIYLSGVLIVMILSAGNLSAQYAVNILIDPGHGGSNNGTQGYDGNYEKTVTLTLGWDTEYDIANGVTGVDNGQTIVDDANIYMTRTYDTFVYNYLRGWMARGEYPDAYHGTRPQMPDGTPGAYAFLSIHCNDDASSTTDHGTSAMIWNPNDWVQNPPAGDNPKDYGFAETMVSDYVNTTKSFEPDAQTAYGNPTGVVGRNSITVLDTAQVKNNGYPQYCTLLETEFASDPQTWIDLENSNYESLAAEGMAKGIFDLLVATPVGCDYDCPPAPPTGLQASIVGQSVVLNWNSYADQTALDLQIWKNGQELSSVQTSQTSYTDANAVNSLPAVYQVSAVNTFGESYTPTIGVSTAPSTIASNTTWSGVIYVSTSVSVNAGSILQIYPGTKVVFEASQGVSLTVNGSLEAEGASNGRVIFTSSSPTPSPGDWGSIVLNGSGANGSTIDYANIDYGTEVKVNQANNVTIENCNIYDNYYHGIEAYYASDLLAQSDTIANANANHGILITGGSSNNCNQNVIYKTNHVQNGAGIEYSGSSGYVAQNDIEYYNWGIGVIWGASPSSYWNSERNNRITHCIYGLMVYHESFPTFGTVPTSPYSWNSIYSNTYNASLNTDGYNTSTLPAEGNYWATSNPNPTFTVGQNSSVDCAAALSNDPWSGLPLPTGAQLADESHVPIASTTTRVTDPQGEIENPSFSADMQDSLLLGIELRDEKKFDQARNYLIAFISRHPDQQAAYVELYSCADSETTPGIISFFQSLPAQASEEQKLLLANLYLDEGRVDSAQHVDDQIMKEGPNSVLSTKAELNNFYIALYNNNDPVSAAQILAQVEGEASLLEGTELSDAEAALKFYVDPNTGRMPNMGSQQTGLSNQPQVNGLAQNYPNPFNPTTVVSYNLKSAGHVTLKVYDVLGREVMTLVDGYQNAGLHSAEFNGAKLASGVYFYRLTAPGVSQVKKMLMIK